MSNRTGLRSAAAAAVLALAAVTATQAVPALVSTASAAGYTLATPQSLRVSSTTTTSVNLAWKATPNATLYRVATSTSSAMANPVYSRSRTSTATIGNLRSGTDYYFRARAINPDGSALSANTPVVSGRTQTPPTVEPTPPPVPAGDTPVDVRVASYNVLSVSLDKVQGEQRPWVDRRDAVLDAIAARDLDVVGLQEVNQSVTFASRLVDGENQYLDVKNGLNKRGGSYALTNEWANNCVRAFTSSSCEYQYRGASGDNRILYNTETVRMVSEGSYQFASQVTGGKRSMAYAVLEMKATGARFLFTDTHLEVAGSTIREQQWGELIAKVKELRGSLPVINVGDYNVQKFDVVTSRTLPAMKAAGFGDVLNQEYQVNPSRGVRAERLVNGWINSNNRMSRDVASYSYTARHDKTGNNIDWIFATNSLRVKEWETVLDYDPATLQVRGVLPSDHNMVRATITLP